MSYLVLARKWRPQKFSEVIGQDTVTSTLKNALKSGRVAHAYLLTGSRGVGKTTIARILAKCLVCENVCDFEPCNHCGQCNAITHGSSLDVMEIDGASNTSVDDIRALREGARYQPTSAKLKVFIIDEVHMLSTSAFNALLKILEEPPPHVKFIFATTEPHKIPVTILSRCQRFDFGRVPCASIVGYLQTILAAEEIALPEQSLYVIAKAAQGGMRDALSLLDQVISFSGGQPTHDDVIRILGLTPRTLVLKIIEAILNADALASLLTLAEIHSSGHDLSLLMEEITTEFRHLVVVSVVGSAKNELADLSVDELKAIESCAAQHQLEDLQRLFSMALEAINSVAKAHNPVLSAELAIIKMAKRPVLYEMQSIAEAISRLERLSAYPSPQAVQGPKNESVTRPALSKVQGVVVNSASIRDDNVVTSAILKDIDESWLSFVKSVAEKSILLSSHLEHGHFVATQKNADQTEVLVEFHHRVHHNAVHESLAILQSFVQRHFGNQAVLKLVLKAFVAGPQAVNISDAREEEKRLELVALTKRAHADPLVKKAVELFGGEVLSVTRTVNN